MELLKLARRAVETYVTRGEVISPNRRTEKAGAFVTIYKVVGGKKLLRGCMGIPEPAKFVEDAVVEAAVSACNDPRFPPLTEEELGQILIEVSVLSQPVETSVDEIKPGDGVIVRKGILAGLLLPQVWKEIPDKERFLSALCLKAGLNPTAWKYDRSLKFWKFGAKVFSECRS